jgi:hypothetical protein
MSDQTSPDAGAVASEASNPEVEQDKATLPEADTQAATDDTTAEAKTFTQDELNDIVKKEKARAEAKAERRVLKALERLTPQQAAQQQQQAPVDTRPSRRDGENDDAYLDRLTDWKLDQRDRAGNQQRAQEQNRSLEAKTANLYAEAGKTAGFDRDDFDALPLTPILAKAVVESDLGPKLMVFMAANPEEVSRIAALSEVRQAAEIGKLETRLSASNPSRAPSPITPIGSRGTANPSLETASLDDYMKLRAKQGASWARNR